MMERGASDAQSRSTRGAWEHSAFATVLGVLALAIAGCSDAEGDDQEGQAVECTNERKCPSPEVCLLGECKLGVENCRASSVECADAPPACSEGMTASVEGTCWGDCIATSLCSGLDDCSACDADGSLCVELPLPFESFFVCSDADTSACDPLACGCLGTICGGELVCETINNGTVKCTQDHTEGGAAGTEAVHY